MWRLLKQALLAVKWWFLTKKCHNPDCKKRTLKSELTDIGFMYTRLLCKPCLTEYRDIKRQEREEARRVGYERLVQEELELLRAKEEARARFAAERGSPYRAAACRVDIEEPAEEEATLVEGEHPGISLL